MRRTILAVVLLACNADPVSRATSDNPQVEVVRLLTVDGCSVYRFRDGGFDRYFARCGECASVSWQQNHGKTSSPESIGTACASSQRESKP